MSNPPQTRDQDNTIFRSQGNFCELCKKASFKSGQLAPTSLSQNSLETLATLNSDPEVFPRRSKQPLTRDIEIIKEPLVLLFDPNYHRSTH